MPFLCRAVGLELCFLLAERGQREHDRTMRLAGALRTRFAQVLPALSVIVFVVPVLLGAILIGDLYLKWTLIDEGLVAQGIVVETKEGRNEAGEDYCVEEIAFDDHLGKPQHARRSCAGAAELGEKVTVHYSATNPGRAYVAGDVQFENIALFFGAVSLGFLC